MDRFDSLRLFVRIVEQGSFTRAAADLSIPRATATHAIKALEERLGARLLERTTRKVTATLDGQQYYQRCQRILAELDAAEVQRRFEAAAAAADEPNDEAAQQRLSALLGQVTELYDTAARERAAVVFCVHQKA